MEGVVQNFCSEMNGLFSKLQASENALAEERAKVFEFKAGAEVARAHARNLEGDNKRLREDLQVLREENKSLRERIGHLEESLKAEWDRLQTQLMEQPKEPPAPYQSTLGVGSSLKRPCDDEEHPDLSGGKRLRMTTEASPQCPEIATRQSEEEDGASFGEKKDGPNVTAKFMDSLAECLSCTPLRVSPAPSLPKVTTAFIEATYEATSHHTVNLIPAHRNPTGNGQLERRISWPPSDKNPMMPRFPGRSGLLYLEMHEPVPDGPLGLVHVLPRHDRLIERAAYLGEYVVWDMGQMTTEWFAAQIDSVCLDLLSLHYRIPRRGSSLVNPRMTLGDPWSSPVITASPGLPLVHRVFTVYLLTWLLPGYSGECPGENDSLDVSWGTWVITGQLGDGETERCKAIRAPLETKLARADPSWLVLANLSPQPLPSHRTRLVATFF
ncbi:hypothetical protein BKA70DRAFT_1533519 [Coprinopsis sp. MPI-PUGE-AT-0042]|nr:hypothetical protein BKA70DRAFT_1533519 [Coprinopsis sp. MPI-PUGE-AT-0042]